MAPVSSTPHELLLVKPRHFSANEQTAVSNVFQKNVVYRPETAAEEFTAFVSNLSRHLIAHTVFPDREISYPSPDSLFPNNWISTHEDGAVVLYSMEAPIRRTEIHPAIVSHLKERYQIKRLIDKSGSSKFLEGTGSLVFDHQKKIALACLSSRTDPDLAEEVCHELGYSLIPFRAVDERGIPIYHTNVCLCLGEQFAILCLDAICENKELVLEALRGRTIIEITYAQLRCFCANAIEVLSSDSQRYLLMSERAHHSFTDEQLSTLSEFVQPLSTPISTIEDVGGGGIRCMCLDIHLPPRVCESLS